MDPETDGTKTGSGDSPAFGDLLRQYRRRRGLTQEALAERAGVSVPTITALERGVSRTPRRDTLRLLADALQLSGEERAYLDAVRVAGSVRARSRPASDPVPMLPDHAQGRTRPRVLILASVSTLILALLISVGSLVVFRSTPSTAHRPAVASQPILRAVWGGAVPDASFLQPTMIAVDPTGIIYVADDARGIILKLSPTGQFLQSWRVPPPPWSGTVSSLVFVYHAFLTVDRRGDLYVVDQGHNRIQKFSPTGERLAAWGKPGINPGQFAGPSGIAVDQDGNVYVSEAETTRVQKLSSEGRPLEQWGTEGREPAQFESPAGLALNSQGDIYVVDSGNDRIQELSPTGEVLAAWGTYGSGPGEFENAQAVAVDTHDNVYVVDTGNDRIQKFNSRGNFLVQWGTTGSKPGEFKSPVDLAFDRQGHLYVADAGNDRVQVLSPTGRPLSQWTSRAMLRPVFDSPRYLAHGTYGQLFVTDAGNNRVVVLSSRGEVLREWGSRGTGPGQFLHPTG